MSAPRHWRNLAAPMVVVPAAATWIAAAGSAAAASTGNSTWSHPTAGAQSGHTTRVKADDSTRSDPAHVTIKSSTVPGLGSVLVNEHGRVLYIFKPDKRNKVTCTGTCAVLWPPRVAKNGRKPAAGGHVKRSMLGTVPNPDGPGRVVTYHGWPLYTYVADTSAGQADGQALTLDGGRWYVISPAGKAITKKH